MISATIRRSRGILFASALAACQSPLAQEGALDVDSDEGAPPELVTCAVDDDCVLTAASCCECPSFAISRTGDSVSDDACSNIDCEPLEACPAIVAACAQDTCIVQCAPLPCDLSCASGFASDALGCLTCECRGEPEIDAAACIADADCIRVAADCCGCTRGGEDTAVPIAQAEAYIDALGCHDSAACPDVDTCDDALVPRCVAGACALELAVDAPPGPAGARCGKPTLPPCPDGTVCVLNDPQANDATLAGVGICRSV